MRLIFYVLVVISIYETENNCRKRTTKAWIPLVAVGEIVGNIKGQGHQPHHELPGWTHQSGQRRTRGENAVLVITVEPK